MHFLSRSLGGIFLFALTLGLLGSAVALMRATPSAEGQGHRPPPAAERIFAADVVALDYRDLQPKLVAYGEIRSNRRLELRASAAGTILALAPAFEDGGMVRKGDVLVQLDPAQAQAVRDSAVASRTEAEAALAQAERALAIAGDDLEAARAQAGLRQKALQRQLDLNARGIGSAAVTEEAELAASAADQAVLSRRSALSQAQATLDQAGTALSRARIDLAEAERELSLTTLRAGFDGNLAAVSVVQGGLVSVNEMLGELIDPSALEVSFRVSTSQFLRLTDAQGEVLPLTAQVALETADAQVRSAAKLLRVGAAVETGTAGRLLYAQLQSARGFRPGDFVTVTLDEPLLEHVARLPAQAVDGNGALLALDHENRLYSAQARILRREGDTILVRSDLPQGTQVVARRSPLLGQGIKLRPLDQGASLDQSMIDLTPARRQALVAVVQKDATLSGPDRAGLLAQLQQERVPAAMVARLEQAGG
ncbi:HlyD family efflux transporter periplasmic adaptor subunit [Thioclava sp. GXIMD4216]|uniref:HlyD family efflux transporter periplasmic adaptor subunit n=1 Tax=Thioclava litoralis TaxID=3076557 RepID=A0ABZ1DYP1_9RHOB|nr:HlyD family efflux transporter periplasmic adaptor subunit [Thioclava sp. FTW29]